ncbi:PPC domain-containing protein, partial [Sphaerothrix gracilis]|uniref:PPC domain-containing protein n=1 Tax=Sphaerothrix gracilis TaxID=3151835 RepID=UPI0031FBF585
MSFARSAAPTVVAQQTTRSPEVVTGQLNQNSPVREEDGSFYQSHTFQGAANESLTIELSSDEFDTYLILIGPEGNTIAQNDDGAGGTNSRITVTLPTTGVYTIIANSYTA